MTLDLSPHVADNVQCGTLVAVGPDGDVVPAGPGDRIIGVVGTGGIVSSQTVEMIVPNETLIPDFPIHVGQTVALAGVPNRNGNVYTEEALIFPVHDWSSDELAAVAAMTDEINDEIIKSLMLPAGELLVVDSMKPRERPPRPTRWDFVV